MNELRLKATIKSSNKIKYSAIYAYNIDIHLKIDSSKFNRQLTIDAQNRFINLTTKG